MSNQSIVLARVVRSVIAMGAIFSTEQAFGLSTVDVIGDPGGCIGYCGGDFGGGYDDGGWSGPGDNSDPGGGTPVGDATYDAPHHANHPDSANCNAGTDARWASANYDARQLNLAEITGGDGPLQSGSIVTVSYNNGGSERWQVLSSFSSNMIATIPIAGSLQCPVPV